VREFLDEAFSQLELDGNEHVKFDSRYLRPTEVAILQGDAAKARDLLGWKPKVGMRELCRMMIEADLQLAERERTLVEAGYTV